MKKKWLILLVLVGSIAALWAFWIEPSQTVYREEVVVVPTLPDALSGLKVALLSDLHIGSPHMSLERLREIVERTNAYQPDVILLAGDYVITSVLGGHLVQPDEIFPELNKLRAPMGVYAVMGNHEWLHGYDAVMQAAAERGSAIHWLEDKAVTLRYQSQDFVLMGITDFYEGPHAWEPMVEQAGDAFMMALTHTPDIFPELPSNIALTFAGHTHGGQVYIPLLGRLVVPSHYGERYAIGLVEEAGHQLFVSAGVGTSILGVRFLTPPEVNLLTLMSADELMPHNP